jgi:hypothetical protein
VKKIKKIIIVNCYTYCGGPLVLSELCRCLNKIGFDARLFLLHTFPTTEKNLFNFSRKDRFIVNIKLAIAIILNRLFPTLGFNKKYFPEYFKAPHLKGCKLQISPFFSDKNTIVLYPEIVYGNPLKAKNVVRWLLYFNRYPNDTQAYNEKDLFITFRELFNDFTLNPSLRTVKINYFDKNLYKQTNFSKRTGNCYFIRKGRNRKDLPLKFDGPILDDLSEEEKVKILNECEFCYSYDTQTFYSSIASICGCKSIIVPEPGKNKNDYLGADDERPYGIAYGTNKEELEWAEDTRKQLSNRLNYEKSNMENAQLFTNYVKDYFEKRQK